MFIVKYYLLGALVALLAAIYIPQIVVSLLLLWVSLSLALVSAAYLFDFPSIFRKSQDGKIVWWIRWAFIPFLLGAKAYNAWERTARYCSSHSTSQRKSLPFPALIPERFGVSRLSRHFLHC